MALDVPKTFGSLLLGGLFASSLSGVVIIQVLLYFKLYATDSPHMKLLVLAIWFLDSGHTAFIWSCLWDYLIRSFGNPEQIDIIHWSLALTIVFTAILTFLVHIFFTHRIHMLSKKNWYLTTPILILVFLRLLSASVCTAKMMQLGTFSKFKEEIHWIFTTGLALSSGLDILITASLFVLLRASRTGAANLNAVIDSLIRYAFETGSLTCASTIVSMICWLIMPNNLIFMGLHFVISKLYANSLLVTLNMRVRIRRTHSISSGSGHKSNRTPVQLSLTEAAANRHSRRAVSGQKVGLSPISPTFGLVRAGLPQGSDDSQGVGLKRRDDEVNGKKSDVDSDEYEREVELELDASVNSRTRLRGVVEVNVERSIQYDA